MTPKPGVLAVSITDLQNAAQKIAVESSSVDAAPDASCAVPAMPRSTTDDVIPHLIEAVNNSKHVVAGRLQAISEAIASAATAFSVTEEQSAHNLAAIGNFNTPLPAR